MPADIDGPTTTATLPAMKLLFHSSFALTGAQRSELLESRPDLQIVERRTGDPETLEGDGVTVLVSEGVPRDLSRWASLRWVQLLSAGANQLRGHPILESGITVTTASGTHGVPIAQFVTCSWLMMAHQLPRIIEFKQSREWPNRLAMEGFTVRGRTAGIIGYGSIGRECGRQLHALGMRILCSKRDVTARADDGNNAWPGTGDPDGFLPEEWFRSNELDLMLPRCDLVVVTVPSTPSTDKMFGPREFACLKHSARMIIVSRGGIVDEVALADSLRSGRLTEAAVDCFVREPLPRDHPFFDLPNVLLTPHMSGVYDSFGSVFLGLLAENLRRFEGGDDLLNRVDAIRGY
jgi:phosphoglycerate dehydrogenase-like enzyme